MRKIHIQLNRSTEVLLGGQVGGIIASGLCNEIVREFAYLSAPFLNVLEEQKSRSTIARVRFTDEELHLTPVWNDLSEEICISSRLPARESAMQLMNVCRLAFKIVLCRAGAVNVHAAALSFGDDCGLLFSGVSGSGKTTLLLSLLKLKGATVIANDQALLFSSNSDIYAIGMPSLLGISRNELEVKPGLVRFIYSQLDASKPLLDLRGLCSEYKGMISGSMRVSAVVTMTRSHQDQSFFLYGREYRSLVDIPGFRYPISDAYPSEASLAAKIVKEKSINICIQAPKTIQCCRLSIGLSCLRDPPEHLVRKIKELCSAT